MRSCFLYSECIAFDITFQNFTTVYDSLVPGSLRSVAVYEGHDLLRLGEVLVDYTETELESFATFLSARLSVPGFFHAAHCNLFLT